jgi:hypothetical protein
MHAKVVLFCALLLCSGSLLAHGPHSEILGAGLLEDLTHLLAHAWPVVPAVLIGLLLFRRTRTD